MGWFMFTATTSASTTPRFEPPNLDLTLEALTEPRGVRFARWPGSPLLKREEPAMALARMPDDFYDLVSHHLPPEQPAGRRGGRPPIAHRPVLNVLWFVLASGCRWDDVPPEMGCSGRTAQRRLRAWEELGIWDRLHADLL